MAWRRGLLLALLGAPSAAPAYPNALECDDLGGQPINRAVSWQDDVKPIFNEVISPGGRCTSCHNVGQPAGALDLTDEGIDAIYKLVPSHVVPGDPQASILFDKINCNGPGSGGLRMPYLQNPLTLEQQGLVYDWIAQGALGEPEGEPAIVRDFIFRDGIESLR